MLKELKEWLIATLFLLLIGYFWFMSTLVKLPVLLPVFVISKFTRESMLFGKRIQWSKWAYNMFISDDQDTNSVLGGDRDITVSSRVGYNAIDGNTIALKMERVINYGFLKLAGQEDHCRVSIERDEQHNKDWGG